MRGASFACHLQRLTTGCGDAREAIWRELPRGCVTGITADRTLASGAALRDQPRPLGGHDPLGDDRHHAQATHPQWTSCPPRLSAAGASLIPPHHQGAWSAARADPPDSAGWRTGIEQGPVWTVPLAGRTAPNPCQRVPGRQAGPVEPCRRQRPLRTRSSADRPTGPQFGFPPGRPRSPFWPINIRNRLFIAASPRARRTAASSACG